MTLFSFGINRFSDDTSISITGRFNFQNLNFADSTRFILQARDQKNKRNLRIDLDDNSPAKVHILNTMKYQQVKENPESVKYRENTGAKLINLQ